MADFISTALSDNCIFAKSKRLYNKASGVYNIIRIPRFAFLSELYVSVITPMSGGTPDAGSLLVGFSGNQETADPNGFIDTAADIEVAGMYKMSTDAQPGSAGKWFNDGSGMVTITIDNGDHTTLADFHIFMEYAVIY